MKKKYVVIGIVIFMVLCGIYFGNSIAGYPSFTFREGISEVNDPDALTMFEEKYNLQLSSLKDLFSAEEAANPTNAQIYNILNQKIYCQNAFFLPSFQTGDELQANIQAVDGTRVNLTIFASEKDIPLSCGRQDIIQNHYEEEVVIGEIPFEIAYDEDLEIIYFHTLQTDGYRFTGRLDYAGELKPIELLERIFAN